MTEISPAQAAPTGGARSSRAMFWRPPLAFVSAAALLVISIFTPYWSMTLHAPQYPGGLHVTAYINRLEGDVAEIDGLNHYIGMRPLGEAAQLERSLAVVMTVVLAATLMAAIFIHSPWTALLAAPAVLFPAVFLLDLHYWLSSFGQNLDPAAPLSSSIKPFTPPVLGEGMVGQFRTVAAAGVGWWLAALASVNTLGALWLQRRVYKPTRDAKKKLRAEKKEQGA